MPLKGRLEAASNIAVLVTAAVVSLAVVHREWPGATTASSGGLQGKTISLAAMTLHPAKLNLVLALSTACHFCEEETPFYRSLGNLQLHGRAAVLAVFPQDRATAAQYLAGHSIRTDAVLSHPLSDYGIVGTPTLMLVDAAGKIRRAWVGALNSVQKQEVLDNLQHDL